MRKLERKKVQTKIAEDEHEEGGLMGNLLTQRKKSKKEWKGAKWDSKVIAQLERSTKLN